MNPRVTHRHVYALLYNIARFRTRICEHLIAFYHFVLFVNLEIKTCIVYHKYYQTGYVLSSLSKVWNSPHVAVLQRKLLHVWRLMLHISKKCLKGIQVETPLTTPYFEQEHLPAEVLSNKCPDVCQNIGSYVHIFMVLVALCFMCVIAWYIWNYRKKENKPSSVKNSQLHKNEACEKLKEVHKILQRLNHQLAPAPPSKIPSLQSLHTSKEYKSQILRSRSQLSNISRPQSAEIKLSIEELRQKLQTSLQLLEEINIATNNTPSEWISNFEKDEAVLSAANDITHTKISTNLKEQKDTEANQEFPKNQTFLASHSENSFSKFNYSSSDHKKENPSPKSLYSNCSSLSNSKRNMSNEYLKRNIWMSLQHLEKASTNEKFATSDTLKYPQENISSLKNVESESFLYEAQSQFKKRYSKPIKSKSSQFQNMKNEQIKSLESTYLVNEALKYHQENISGLKKDENERILHELEEQWNEMIRTPVRLNSQADQNMKYEQIKSFESSGSVPVAEVDYSWPQSSSYDVIRSDGTDPRKECLNQKDVFYPFHHEADYEDITSRRRVKESKATTSGSFIKYPENNKSGSTFQGLNLNDLQPASIGSRIVNDNEFSRQTLKVPKRKDFLNVSGKKKALNISILFNRDIQLDKCV